MPPQTKLHVSNALSVGRKILVVDDEPEILFCYRRLLDDYFKVITAASGSEAIKKINEEIALVILDYRLRDISGIELLKEIKNIFPSLPVIIATGYGDEELVINAFRYGAKDYIKKPFDARTLLNGIERVLSIHIPKKSAHVDCCDSMTTEESPHTHYKIQNAIKYINDNYSAKISLAAAANKACMSKYHFSRSFKKATCSTYRDYLNNCRIEKAKKLLKRGSLSITEIAFAVGYTDLVHFDRLFKRITGLTPSKYKVQNQEK